MCAETVNLLGARNKEICRLKTELADRAAVIEALEADRVMYQGKICNFIVKLWYGSDVSIIFDVPCLIIYHCQMFL